MYIRIQYKDTIILNIFRNPNVKVKVPYITITKLNYMELITVEAIFKRFIGIIMHESPRTQCSQKYK